MLPLLRLLVQKDELNRLRDGEGRPPGVMGWWPSRATTFLENHDTVRLFISSYTFFTLTSAVNCCGPSIHAVASLQHNMSLHFVLSGIYRHALGRAQLSIAAGQSLCSIASSLSRLSVVIPFASCHNWITQLQ